MLVHPHWLRLLRLNLQQVDVLALGDVPAVVMALVNGDAKELVREAAKGLVEVPVGEVVMVAVVTVAEVIVEALVLVHVRIRVMEDALVVVGVRLVDKLFFTNTADYEKSKKCRGFSNKARVL